MNHFLLTAAIWLVATTVCPGKVTLDAPEGPIEVGQIIDVTVNGVSDADLRTAKAIHYPRLRTYFRPGRSWGGPPYITFSARLPGTYLIAVFAAGDYAEVELVVGGSGPDPPIPPVPPVPGEKYKIVILYESNDVDDYPKSQQVLLSSQKFRSRLKSEGHQLLAVVDQHAKGPKGNNPPPELADYFGVCEGDPMPRIVIAPLNGQGKPKDFNLPLTEAKVFGLLEKGGE